MQLRRISSASIKSPIVKRCLWAVALIATATSLPAGAAPDFARDYRGAMYAQSGDAAADQAAALALYRNCADQGYATTVQWHQKAAVQGFAPAQQALQSRGSR